jgi:hypothetical protein
MRLGSIGVARPPIAAFLDDALKLFGVWSFCSFFTSGVAGVWAGLKGEDIGGWATAGAAAGFALGAPVTLAAGLWLL